MQVWTKETILPSCNHNAVILILPVKVLRPRFGSNPMHVEFGYKEKFELDISFWKGIRGINY